MEQQKQYREQFAAFERSLNGESSTPIHALRRTAMAHFERSGFPTSKDEEWRFTNVAPIASRAFRPTIALSKVQLSAKELDQLTIVASNRIVFVNGHFAPSLSTITLPPHVRAAGLADIHLTDRPWLEQHLGRSITGTESAFTALNTSFLQDGFVLHIPAKIEVPEPIMVVYVTDRPGTDAATNPRNLIVLEEQSAAKVVEYYVSRNATSYLTNAVTEIVLGQGSRLEHDKVQVEDLTAYHVSAVHVRQEAKSVYVSNSFALGGALVRNELTSLMNDERCECTFNGLSVGTGDQLIDNHTTIDHAKPNCKSWEVYKSVLAGRSRGVFNGKIFVRTDAQKTDAKQTNKTLLLSDEATIDTKPQLEIFADDVKCTHGATVGQLDEEQVFYLRTRGIREADARDILTFAFADEVVGHISVEALRVKLEEIIHQRLGEGRAH